MIERFEVILLTQAYEFVAKVDFKARKKILQNLSRAQSHSDPKLFKKLDGDIWEFRTLYAGKQYRLMAFWDKSDARNTLVIATHGIVKKTSKIRRNHIERARKIRLEYFKSRSS